MTLNLLKYLFLLAFLIFRPAYSLAAPNKVCDNLYLLNAEVSLTDNEKKLICDGETKGWRKIPLNQKLTQTKIFLQSRGYFSPTVNIENRKAVLDPGKISYIENVEFINAPEAFNREKYIGSIGKVLTPENLDEIKAWTMGKLASVGYPCALAEGRASHLTGLVKIKITPNQSISLESVVREDNTRFKPHIFSRYDAFELGKRYNDDLLHLTSQRVINSGLVSYSYFNHECSKPTHLDQKFMSKKPNTMIFGFGGSSEEFPIFEFKWKNTGLDEKGSELNTNLYLSNLEQKFETGIVYYPILSSPRFSLRPNFEWSRKKEDIFETEEKKVEIAFRKTRDTNTVQLVAEVVPAQSIETNMDSDLPERINITSLDLNLNILEHYFEYYRNSPRKGYMAGLSLTPYRSSSDDYKASGTVLNFGGTYLKNIADLDPPNLILGARFFFNTIMTEEIERIPQTYRLYLGGQDDIRGFSRKSINNDEIGFKTTAHLAFEGRFTSVLPYKLQPYIFYDFAKAGLEEWQFSQELYHSPGVGLRFESPFGNFRFNIAKGMIADNQTSLEEGYNFYFSYGREF